MLLVALGWLYTLGPPACWAALARTRVVGAAVGAVLVAWAVLLGGLEYEWWALRAQAEIEVGYPVVALLVVLAGTAVERRLRGPRPKEADNRRVGGATVAMTCELLAAVVLVCTYPVLIAGEPYYPSRAELPLPPGLALQHDSGTGGSCGLHECIRSFQLVSSDHLPPAEAAARLRAELLAEGWTADPYGLTHPHGWLLDRRTTAVGITEGPTGVTVELDGGDTYG